MALVSGLRLSSKSDGYLQLQMALDMLSGNLGSGADQELASKVVRVVIAGNSAGVFEAHDSLLGYHCLPNNTHMLEGGLLVRYQLPYVWDLQHRGPETCTAWSVGGLFATLLVQATGVPSHF